LESFRFWIFCGWRHK